MTPLMPKQLRSIEVYALFLSGDTTSFRGKSPQFVVCSNPLPPNIKIPNCILEVMRSHFFIETNQHFLWVFLILNSNLLFLKVQTHTSIKFFNPILEMITSEVDLQVLYQKPVDILLCCIETFLRNLQRFLIYSLSIFSQREFVF